MTQNLTPFNPEETQVVNSEQVAQIIEAIIAGKYSWACVLLLRFSGYEPSHLIPYNTYNRILKQNMDSNKLSTQGTLKSRFDTRYAHNLIKALQLSNKTL